MEPLIWDLSAAINAIEWQMTKMSKPRLQKAQLLSFGRWEVQLQNNRGQLTACSVDSSHLIFWHPESSCFCTDDHRLSFVYAAPLPRISFLLVTVTRVACFKIQCKHPLSQYAFLTPSKLVDLIWTFLISYAYSKTLDYNWVCECSARLASISNTF